MKKYFFATILISGLAYSQNTNVGIDTNAPTRKLDVNGDLRVTTGAIVTNNSAYDRIVTTNNSTGDVDYITIPAIFQTSTNNVEVKRSVYLATGAVTANECNCGDITFRINNNNTPEFKLNSTTIFATNNNITTFDLGYGIKRWSNNAYSYANRTVTFTTANYATYQTLDATAFPTTNDAAGNTVRIYTIIPPKQNHLYRLTLSRTNNNNTTTYAYALVCERFYMQTL
ncbi:hypothetical protein ACFO4P_12565 [Epilithonimonas pallida]|uniref:Uncharacterized protein n=1 Tax=Epilithonimonas pallida TaxID=373671 RepID=A0ABY1R5B0_9FLAO|nr:hypothetical protein [Epilithonimonas pallida]SMP95355.1 hypothetical protein SAMN05421679_10755 [Epilithonimonas pallida]